MQRSVRQLSGGERRRVALALALGFADLASARTGLRCNLLVLDEVGTSLEQKRNELGYITMISPSSLLCIILEMQDICRRQDI